jgi:TonB family protein
MQVRTIAYAIVAALLSFEVRASTVTIEPEPVEAGATAAVPSKPLSADDADYPLQSLLANESGTVQLNLLLDQSGKVFFVQTLRSSGTPRLDQAAAAIARTKWAFQPATKDGMPASGNIKVTVAWKAPLELADEYKRDVPAMANLAPDEQANLRTPVARTEHSVTADDYPPISIRLLETGVVQMRYLIGEDGNVSDVQITHSSGHARLDDAAMSAVKKRWHFQPATLNGRPTSVWVPAEFVFCLDKCIDTTRICRPEPILGDTMQMTPAGSVPSVKVSQWIHVTENGAVDSLILQTDDGWMRASKAIVDAFSSAVHYPPAAEAKRSPSCWFNGSVTVTAK